MISVGTDKPRKFTRGGRDQSCWRTRRKRADINPPKGGEAAAGDGKRKRVGPTDPSKRPRGYPVRP
jgi:hypothetical protein